MTTSSTSSILQQAYILATGTAASDSMLAYLETLVQQGGGGYGLVAQQVDAYMGAVEAAQGTAATIKALALNGLGIVLTDADGRQWDLTDKPAISLCRCGASQNRPFCDGSHKTIGFQCAASPGPLT